MAVPYHWLHTMWIATFPGRWDASVYYNSFPDYNFVPTRPLLTITLSHCFGKKLNRFGLLVRALHIWVPMSYPCATGAGMRSTEEWLELQQAKMVKGERDGGTSQRKANIWKPGRVRCVWGMVSYTVWLRCETDSWKMNSQGEISRVL